MKLYTTLVLILAFVFCAFGQTEKSESKGVANSVTEAQAKELLTSAEGLFLEKRYDAASQIVRQALSVEPMSSDAYLLLGKISLRQGELKQSINSLKTAIFWNNRQLAAHIELGKVYLLTGDCTQAKNYLGTALILDNTNKEAIALTNAMVACSN